MTRKEYLDKLRGRLCFLLTDREVSEILRDMEECFDAGTAEGKSEEDVCRELGDPVRAAKEILSERGGAVNPTRSQLAEKYLPPLICTALALLYFWITARTANRFGYDRWYNLLIGILLPTVMWLIQERKNFFRSLRTGKGDFFSLAGAALMFTAAALFMPYSNAVLAESHRAAAYISVAQAAAMVSAEVMLLLSVLKSGRPRWLAAVPAVLAAVPIAAAPISAWLLTVRSYEATGNGYFYPYFGRALNLYSTVIIALLIIFLLWAVVNRNAFSVPTLYLSVMGGMSVCGFRACLGTLDPASENLTMEMSRFIPSGAAAAVISFTAIAAVRAAGWRKGGDD